MVLESTSGAMEEYTKVSGLTTRWMEKVYSYGRMVGNILDHIARIKNMDQGHLNGQMGHNILVNGKMESRMVQALLLIAVG